MRLFDYHRTVIAYHGCDQAVAEQILAGSAFSQSLNPYDWLGKGIYFWEFGPERALEWARQVAKRRPERIKNPCVIGAVLQLGTCFDLLDTRFTRYLGEIYPIFVAGIDAAGAQIPTNKSTGDSDRDLVLRFRDCAFLNWAIPRLETEGGIRFHTVRCAFLEGEPAFPGAGIKERSHIQIAVRDPAAIVGAFRPSA